MVNYLDRLPEDIHERILTFVINRADKTLRDARYYLPDNDFLPFLLSYAKENQKQRRAAMGALYGKLSPFNWSTQITIEAVLTFGDLLRELDLEHAPLIDFGRRFPAFPEICKVALYATELHFPLITNCPKLEELKIIFDNDRYSRIWSPLVASLAQAPVKTLQLHFSTTLAKTAFFHVPRREHDRLRDACPAVEHLQVTGLHNWTTPFQNMISGLPSLKKLTRTGWMTDNVLEWLRTIKELELLEPILVARAAQLGKSVTGIIEITRQNAESVASVRLCPNLRRLSIVVEEAAEEELVHTTGELEELGLRWHPSSSNMEFELLPFFTLPVRCPVFHEPSETVLMEIVRANPRLKTFKLEHVIVKAEQVEKLLSMMGERLETLELPIDWQNERTALRLERILSAIARYCPNLRAFIMVETRVITPYNPAPPLIPASSEEKASCLRALERVLRNAPHFMSYNGIKSIINRFSDQDRLVGCVWDLANAAE